MRDGGCEQDCACRPADVAQVAIFIRLVDVDHTSEGRGEGSGERGDESNAGSGSGSGSGSGASIGAGRTVAATRRARRPAAVAHVRICIDLSIDFDDVGRAVPGPIQLVIAESRRS